MRSAIVARQRRWAEEAVLRLVEERAELCASAALAAELWAPLVAELGVAARAAVERRPELLERDIAGLSPGDPLADYARRLSRALPRPLFEVLRELHALGRSWQQRACAGLGEGPRRAWCEAFVARILMRLQVAVTACWLERTGSSVSERAPVSGDEASRRASGLEGELDAARERIRSLDLSLTHSEQTKRRFLSSMSHELRTPLNSVIGFSELLSSEHFGALNTRQRRYVELIERSGRHLLDLVNDLLELSRSELAEGGFDFTAIDAAALADSIARQMQSRAAEASVRLAVVREAGSLAAWGDKRACVQILQNFVSNAVKYNREGGEVILRVGVGSAPGRMRWSVEDTGIGIPPGEVSRVFDGLYHASNRPEATEGPGVGLALSRRLAELQGGEVGASSEEGRGSTFWFELGCAPADPRSTASISRSALARDVPLRELTVLVAEDSPGNRALIREVLELRGHRVEIVTDGLRAVEAARAQRPDVILMDVRMPLLDGLEATRQILAAPETRGIPIIALTASADHAIEAEAREAGCLEVLLKPAPAELIIGVIEGAVEAWRE